MGVNRRRFLVASGVAGLAGCTSRLSDVGTDEGGASGGDDGRSSSGKDPADDAHDERSSAQTLLDFEDLDPWQVIEGDLSADTENRRTGSQSARIDVGTHQEWARIERPLEIDLSEHRLAITCRVHGGDVASQAIDLIVADGAENRLRFRSRVFETGPDAAFIRLHAGTHELRTEDAPELGEIERIRIQSQFDTVPEATIWLDRLEAIALPETPKLMIQWDDGHESQYTEALEIQSRYGIPSTSFVNTNAIGRDGRLDVDRMHEMRDDHGWEFGSHLMDHVHLDETAPAEQERQITGAKRWLIDNGFERGAEYFAYPYGEYDQSSYELVAEHHTIAMVGGEPGYGIPVNGAHVERSSARTLEDARAYLDHLVRWGGFGGLLWHSVPNETPLAEFDAIMRHVHDREAAGEIDVITLGDLERLMAG